MLDEEIEKVRIGNLLKKFGFEEKRDRVMLEGNMELKVAYL